MGSKTQNRPDLQQALDRMEMGTGGYGRHIKAVNQALMPQEQVLEVALGMLKTGRQLNEAYGLAILTDHRVLFFRQGWMNGQAVSHHLNQISSATFVTGMLTGQILLGTSGGQALMTWVNKTDGRRLVQRLDFMLGARGASYGG